MPGTEHDTLNADDAALMLYVAGELDDAGRLSLDERLQTDVGLRGRLVSMTQLDELMRADVEVRAVTVADSRQALSRSLRLVREQALLMQSRPALRRTGGRMVGVPRWVWGTAVAASLAVGMLVWISNSDPTPMRTFSSNTDDAGRIPPGEARAFSAAFLPIEAEGSQGEPSDINAEVDALNMLAIMNEPGENDAEEN